ncbi:MAG TPA: antitermination protein [Scandinavium sp.]|jgi:hypothetical protein
MNLESLPQYFSPKSMMPGAVPCGITADTLTITDIMAALGLANSKAAVGIELFLAKAGVLTPDDIVAYIGQIALLRADRHSALKKMPEKQRYEFLRIIARYVFRDYSLSAASIVTCSSCAGEGFIDAEVFTMKSWRIRDSWMPQEQDREIVRVICKPCNGKGHVKNECRCRGRGEVVDKKKSELQGLPVYKPCPRCKGRGYPRLKDTEVFKTLGVTETTWRRNFKLFYERLVTHCHMEESYAESVLKNVTR